MNLAHCHSLLVFGGSFDPPHFGHVQLPQYVREKLGMEMIAYVPAGRAPHKLDQHQTDSPHRLAMLRLALADQPHTLILTDEIDRADDGRPSYTIDTLESLQTRLPRGATMRLLIGVDQLLIFDQWKDADRIIELAEPIVMLRAPHTRDSVLTQLPKKDRARWSARLIDIPIIDLSSTDIRKRVKEHQPIDHLVPPAVADYIQSHRLYQR